MIRPPTAAEKQGMADELQFRVDAAYATAERLMDEEARDWPNGFDQPAISRQWLDILEVFEESVMMADKALRPILRKSYMTFLLGRPPEYEVAAVQQRLAP